MRAEDPGALAFVHQVDESDPAAFGVVQRALAFPDAAVASDAIAPQWTAGPRDPLAWPLPPRVATHPRTAGTFARTLRLLVREQGALSLPEAVRRCTLVPARIVQPAAPAMRRKGRLQPGSDADVTIFDPDTVSDRSTYTDTTRPSEGIRHVLVGGRFVVRDGVLDTGALPGRAVRGA
ncbi:amidohydrolase family protein [Pseudonocardia cypriaca]|uniref:amidohydrolase family protein n=1 Tax=Pseudonocardia cypriaca TaxID=882449 RepID=UPI00319E1C22